MRSAAECGFAHVHWAAAGFLGDELPSDRFPNDRLLAQALASIRSGDILMAHLGIWSRKDPYAPMLDPLIAGLKARGFCFATIPEHPDYRGKH
jgi:peptidoglycan/xylan/chitin deacetylase (PgdA/CDA1 family)